MRNITNLFKKGNLGELIFIIVFSGVGIFVMTKSLAATYYAIAQPSSAQVGNGASIVDNSKAIGGKMLVFNAAPAAVVQTPGVAKTATPTAAPKTTTKTNSSTPVSTIGSTAGTSGSYSCIIPTGSGRCPTSGYYTDSQIIGGTNPWVNTNIWGANGTNYTQALYANNANNWYIAASVSNNTSGAVLAFPNTGWGMPYPEKAVDSYSSITSSWNVTIPTNSSTTAGWAAYDLWFNNWNAEVMIQTDIVANSNYNCSSSSIVVPSATIAGQVWHMCQFGNERVWKPGPNESAIRNEASGTINVLAFLQYMEQNGELPTGSTWTAGSFGFEVCNTSGTTQDFKLNNFSWTSE